MVQIKKLIVLIGVMLVLASLAQATLDIKSVKVYVNGEKDSGTVDIRPLDNVRVEFKVDNNLGFDLEDVGGEWRLESIDDGDDIDDDLDEEDIDEGDDQKYDFEFDIPLEVDDGSYTLTIEMVGEDVNGTKFTADETIKFDLEKEDDDVYFRTVELSATELKCNRVTDLDINAVNLGKDDQEVVLTVTNSELSLNEKRTFDLENDPFDSDSKHRENIPIIISNDQAAGTYNIRVKAEYSGTSTEEVLTLAVEDCVTAPKPAAEPEETVVVEPVTVAAPIKEETVTEPVATSDDGYVSPVAAVVQQKKSGFTTALVIILEILIVAVAVLGIVFFMKKR